jgi:AICAR transformylase/IMP cyclohydrolase PurH
MSQKIKNALVSLSDKSGIEKILKVLRKYKINIIQTYKNSQK